MSNKYHQSIEKCNSLLVLISCVIQLIAGAPVATNLFKINIIYVTVITSIFNVITVMIISVVIIIAVNAAITFGY